jgi:lipoprotein NlpI
MRVPWISLSFAVFLVCSVTHGQNRPVPGGQQILETARTNLQAALDLCDQAVAKAPTNAQPLLWRAQLLERAQRFDDGIRDLTAALKLAPGTPVICQRRGELYFKAGRFQESVADFDRVIELAPAQRAHHWQRGISLYYARRFADGRKQFELHQTVNPNDVENAAWHFLCAARETSVTNARTIMLASGSDGRVPMKEIEELYRGTGSSEQVLEAARRVTSTTSQREALFYAHLYLGLYFDVLGDVMKAREQVTKAAGEYSAQHYMGDVARVHLREIKSP